MTTNPDQPRQPAGSPTGGEFAAKAGAEATGVDLSVTSAVSQLSAYAVGAMSTAGTKEGAAERGYLELSVHATGASALAACPGATSAKWEWCGDGDSPDTLGEPIIMCPHAGEDGLDAYDFTEAHGIPSETFDSVGFGLSESLMRQLARDVGVTEPDSGVFVLDLANDPDRFMWTIAKNYSTHLQVSTFRAAHPMPTDGNDAIHEWENQFLDQAELPDDERGDVLRFAVQNANRIDYDVQRDPAFLESWARNEYLLEKLRNAL